jgi:hypothetical protein
MKVRFAVNSKNALWLLILIPAIALMGCEGDTGPAGPAGADGADGADGPNGTSLAVCLECHTDQATLQIGMEYVQSGHKEGLFVGYAGSRDDCSRCHSKQGFLHFAEGLDAVDISDPASIDCATCHTVHPQDFALRLTGGVELISDDTYTLDFGDDSNLCANCHQTRYAEPNIAAPADTFAITSTHYGPHHGPQANVLEGVGFAEIAGSADYPAPGSASGHLSAGMTCVDCHMDAYTDGVGGHTWHPSVAACTTCHPGATDFDMNGFQTATQVKLDTLRDRLVELGVIEYVEEDMEYEPIVGTYPMIQAQAFFNWIGLAEDRSLGAHNPGYFDALLDNTIEALAP